MYFVKTLGNHNKEEAAGNESAEQMVQVLVNDFTKVVNELKEGMALADKQNDEITGDMLLALHGTLEKHVWMLNAFLGKTVE